MNRDLYRQPMFWLAAAAVLVLTVYPMVWLATGSVLDKAGRLTFRYYLEMFGAIANLEALKNSLVLAVWSIAIALALGVFAAVTTARLVVPFTRFVRTTSIVAFVSPPWIAAMAYAYLMSPNAGVVNVWLEQLSGAKPFNAYSMTGLVFVTALFLYPYIFLTVSAALANIDSSYEEAAITTGCSPLRTLVRITVPLVTPAMITCVVFSLVMVWSLFSVPALLGTPAKIYVFSTYLLFLLNGFPPRLELASAIAVLFAVVAGGLVWAGFRAARKAQAGRFNVVSGKGHKAIRMPAGRWAWPIAGVNVSIVIVAIVIPYLVVAYMSVAANIYQPSLRLSAFTLAHYLAEFGESAIVQVIRNTLLLAGATALLGSLLALAVAFLDVRYPARASAMLALAAMFPVAVPSVAFVVGVTWAWITSPFVLYGTLTIMVIAQVARFLPLATQHFRDGFGQLHPSLEEAARTCGAGATRTLLLVSLPIIRPVAVATFLLLFMSSMRDLLTPIFLGSGTPETTVMAGRIFFMWGEGEIARAAAGTIIYVVLMGVIYAGVQWLLSQVSNRRTRVDRVR